MSFSFFVAVGSAVAVDVVIPVAVAVLAVAVGGGVVVVAFVVVLRVVVVVVPCLLLLLSRKASSSLQAPKSASLASPCASMRILAPRDMVVGLLFVVGLLYVVGLLLVYWTSNHGYCHCCYCHYILLLSLFLLSLLLLSLLLLSLLQLAISWLSKGPQKHNAVCCWFAVCFVVDGIVVCLLQTVFFNNLAKSRKRSRNDWH